MQRQTKKARAKEVLGKRPLHNKRKRACVLCVQHGLVVCAGVLSPVSRNKSLAMRNTVAHHKLLLPTHKFGCVCYRDDHVIERCLRKIELGGAARVICLSVLKGGAKQVNK